ncbi:3-deoxy-manno-octulosonate cytidylyltransferase [Endozoicomonas sp. SM1973]|uniref:3-deoxy-manno-octulosonate cytidylyltransferase n=1 Tax=Spartinivicinus marinus TaxID=2994442 RepID=A0A853HXA4_9GAMM|nr:3-deoxy-manno-octulosonate cytidylyltransferase [Spartinivicinus marinus]MCX4029425.1 3-deoxy-manno-octulosonate cytidylyltransferase [Spartinivicinus marinus]NYZ64999.1 3-deoxy-manno-octulosonate cytidylyltransferase [Spartinivicinus marinus]
MKFTVVIPARYASTRLPGKPLLLIGDKPMIQHVYQQALQSQAARVVVATDHQGIAEVVQSFGGEVCLTAANHPSGTDRVEEVARKLALADDEVVVNIQGDEPLIPPSVINQVAGLLGSQLECEMATLIESITEVDDLFNQNVVKVVLNAQGEASYFSRAPIPWSREQFNLAQLPTQLPSGPFYRHIGIYGYRVGLLHRYVNWPVAPTEQLECLEQLRALWQGVKIAVAQAVEVPPIGVDTEQDLAKVRLLVEGNADND